MLAKLKLLLQLQAWLKSDGLKLGGGIFTLGAVESLLQSTMGVSLVQVAADLVGVMASTLGAAAMALVGLLQILARLKAEWSVAEKVEGKDKG